MSSAKAHAKINLGLVVGPLRAGGKHEVATALVCVDLHDTLELEQRHAQRIVVEGFEDTIVRRALEELGRGAGEHHGWHVTIDKRIPVAGGLGGGSSDAGAALRLANDLLAEPLPRRRLHELAAAIGSDVPFFLEDGPRLATGTGTELRPISLPLDVWIVLVLPAGVTKTSTAAVYGAYGESAQDSTFDERRAVLVRALEDARSPADLAALPRNDLASSPLADELVDLGALHADVTGAGPTVYGLFDDRAQADRAAQAFEGRGRRWVVRPVGGS
jgi:4-diphosphocytidyl-2-C-methyl-D-erythritol kinase